MRCANLNVPVIEVIHGLGLGGAESLLFQRIRYMSSKGKTLPIVLNVHSQLHFFHRPLEDLGVPVYDIGGSNRFISGYRLWQEAKRLPQDAVVVVHSPWPAAILKIRKALGRMPQRLLEVAHSESYSLPMNLLTRALNRYSDAMIAVSKDVAASTTTANAKNKTVVLAGVDGKPIRQWIEEHPGAPQQMRSELGLTYDARLIVTVANLHEYKGIDISIRALAEIGDEVHLVVVGEGPYRKDLEQLANSLGVMDRVHLLGQRSDAWKWIAVGDVVSHPSRREGLPVTLIEARVIGTPVIASNAGGISTVLGTDNESITLEHVSASALARAIEASLYQAPPIKDAFANRAKVENEWGIQRYIREFNYVMSGEQ